MYRPFTSGSFQHEGGLFTRQSPAAGVRDALCGDAAIRPINRCAVILPFVMEEKPETKGPPA